MIMSRATSPITRRWIVAGSVAEGMIRWRRVAPATSRTIASATSGGAISQSNRRRLPRPICPRPQKTPPVSAASQAAREKEKSRASQPARPSSSSGQRRRPPPTSQGSAQSRARTAKAPRMLGWGRVPAARSQRVPSGPITTAAPGDCAVASPPQPSSSRPIGKVDCVTIWATTIGSSISSRIAPPTRIARAKCGRRATVSIASRPTATLAAQRMLRRGTPAAVALSSRQSSSATAAPVATRIAQVAGCRPRSRNPGQPSRAIRASPTSLALSVTL